MARVVRTVVAIMLIPVGLLMGFVAFAAGGGMRDQCPYGADCHDARLVLWTAGALSVTILAVGTLLLCLKMPKQVARGTDA